MPPKKRKCKKIQPEEISYAPTHVPTVSATLTYPMEEHEAEDVAGDDETGIRKNKVPEFTAQDEQDLCEWFLEHSLFYDLRNANFKNRQKKDNLLNPKSKGTKQNRYLNALSTFSNRIVILSK
jgi:hypothetical protein